MKTLKTGGREIRLHNRSRILEYVYMGGQTTKQQLVDALGMSLPTVIQNVKELLNEGLFRETGQLQSTGGRKATAIAPIPRLKVAVGVDVTRSDLGLVLVDLTGAIVLHRRIVCPFDPSEAYYERVSKTVLGFIADAENLPSAGIERDAILGVGFSIPGIIDQSGEEIVYSHALDIRNVPCGQFSGRLKGLPCAFVNDASAAGFAEARGLEEQAFVYLSLNFCVGGAIFLNSGLYSGVHQHSGEFGHMRLVPGGKRCYCGQIGCVDAYCAAVRLSDLADGSLHTFFRLLEGGDPTCRKAFDEYLNWLALAVTNLSMAYDCEVVVGGHVGSFLGDYLPELKRRAAPLNTFEQNAEYLRVCRHHLEASALGAALLLIDDFFRSFQ
jgi:predicted NBD/HSP70 family sugar kinase